MLNQILSKNVLKDSFYQLKVYKKQLERLDFDHYIISKYHKKWWYQQSLQSTENELWQKALKMAPQIEELQKEILHLEFIINQHYDVLNGQKNSMKPFEGIKLGEYILEQQTLF